MTLDQVGAAVGSTGAATITTTQPSTRVLTDESGSVRAQARQLSQRADRVHQDSILIEWRSETSRHGKLSAPTNLEKLADLGFGWRDIATLVGVSVPAIQKWRRGEGITGDNRLRVASLLAACDLIAEHYLIEEIASWFEMPILDGAPTSPIDLWSAGKFALVFEAASGHGDPEAILSAFDPDWREHHTSSFETFIGADGQVSLRPRS